MVRAYLVVDREVKTFGTREDFRVLLTSFSDGWGVNDRCAAGSGTARVTSGIHSQSGQVCLDCREEELGVFPSDLGEVSVLEEISGEGEEVVLESKQVLLGVDGRVRGCLVS